MKRNEVIDELKEKFGTAIISETQFLGETTLEIDKEELVNVLGPLKCNYDVLMDLTAVDYLIPVKRTKLIYWLHNSETFDRLRVVAFVGREESISSVTTIWKGANWYERELFDLFGIHFEAHPDLKRILLPDEWEGHPLRRDHALGEEPVEFLHGVKPKVPSQIICTTTSQKNIK